MTCMLQAFLRKAGDIKAAIWPCPRMPKSFRHGCGSRRGDTVGPGMDASMRRHYVDEPAPARARQWRALTGPGGGYGRPPAALRWAPRTTGNGRRLPSPTSPQMREVRGYPTSGAGIGVGQPLKTFLSRLRQKTFGLPGGLLRALHLPMRNLYASAHPQDVHEAVAQQREIAVGRP